MDSQFSCQSNGMVLMELMKQPQIKARFLVLERDVVHANYDGLLNKLFTCHICKCHVNAITEAQHVTSRPIIRSDISLDQRSKMIFTMDIHPYRKKLTASV